MELTEAMKSRRSIRGYKPDLIPDDVIADQLFLSDGTVKKHINNIYSKLDVHKSTQAVSHARDLGLI